MFAKPGDLAAFVALVGASCAPSTQSGREEVIQERVAAAQANLDEYCKKQGIKLSDVSNNPEYHKLFDDMLEVVKKHDFLSLGRDLSEPGFLLYVDANGKQGRVVFDYARSVAGIPKRGEFELVGRVQATPASVTLWEPLSVKSEGISTLRDSPEGIRDLSEIYSGPIVGKPKAYSLLTEMHPGVKIVDCDPWEEMK